MYLKWIEALQERNEFRVCVNNRRKSRNSIDLFFFFSGHLSSQSKIIRVLNLWQHHKVFAAEVIQPLIDLADPDHPLHKEVEAKMVNDVSGSLLCYV